MTAETVDSQPSVEVEVSEVPADDVFEADGDSEKKDLSTPMQIPESPAPTAEPSTLTPELSVPTPEPSTSTPEPPVSNPEPPMTTPESVTPTPEPTASAPESVAADKESSADPSFVKMPTWTEIKKPPTAEGRAIPKKAAASTEKKQKSKAKAQERNPFEQIMQQSAPRVPFSLGYIDEDGYQPLVMPLSDTCDAEYYVQSQYNLYLTEMQHIHVSDILV